MTYTLQYDVPGDAGTYERVKEAIGHETPDGLRLHLVVVPPGGGLRHIEVWDSQAQRDRFDRERVTPALHRVLRSIGMTEMPPPPDHDELVLVDLEATT
jgi:hypothetical protein